MTVPTPSQTDPAAETDADPLAALAEVIENARITEDLLREGLLEGVEQVSTAEDWRELPLPDAMVRLVEHFENEHGAVRAAHYSWLRDDQPCFVMAGEGPTEAVDAKEAVLFSSSEVTVAYGTEWLSSHTLICRREG